MKEGWISNVTARPDQYTGQRFLLVGRTIGIFHSGLTFAVSCSVLQRDGILLLSVTGILLRLRTMQRLLEQLFELYSVRRARELTSGSKPISNPSIAVDEHGGIRSGT